MQQLRTEPSAIQLKTFLVGTSRVSGNSGKAKVMVPDFCIIAITQVISIVGIMSVVKRPPGFLPKSGRALGKQEKSTRAISN